MQYTDSELLSDIRDVADQLGHPPTLEEYREHGSYAPQTFYARFESWRHAMEAAGFESRPFSEQIPAEDLLHDLRRIGEELETTPTAAEMREHGTHSVSTYLERFGGWNAALEEAGFVPQHQQSISDQELLDELRRLHDECESAPTGKQMQHEGAYSKQLYIDRFGSWNQSLKQAGITNRKSHNKLSDEELLRELRRLHERLGRCPTTADMRDHGAYSAVTYHRRFESWSAALELVCPE